MSFGKQSSIIRIFSPESFFSVLNTIFFLSGILGFGYTIWWTTEWRETELTSEVVWNPEKPSSLCVWLSILHCKRLDESTSRCEQWGRSDFHRMQWAAWPEEWLSRMRKQPSAPRGELQRKNDEHTGCRTHISQMFIPLKFRVLSHQLYSR